MTSRSPSQLQKILVTKPESTGYGTESPVSALVQHCFDRLCHHEQTAHTDPLTNSVRQLAHELLLMEGDAKISPTQLAQIQKQLTQCSLAFRKSHLSDIVSSKYKPFSKQLAQDDQMPLDDFTERYCQTKCGIVFTAHPTFALSREARQFVAAQVSDRLEPKDGAVDLDTYFSGELLSKSITIKDEHADLLTSLQQARLAVSSLTRQILCEARNRYPTDWVSLVPIPITLASWVGYDLDGRTDISWSETLRIRLAEKALQLQNYADRLKSIRPLQNDADAQDLTFRLEQAAEISLTQSDAFNRELINPENIALAANLLSEHRDDAQAEFDNCIDDLTRLIDRLNNDEDTKFELCVLRADMKMSGAGTSLVHFRINAAQVKSALLHEFSLSKDTDFLDRTTFDTISNQVASVSPVKINAASIYNEPMTARRQLMLCAQILKYVDNRTPIRFLVAESETPATILGVLYLARRYGISDKIDISPLFETPSAIENGGRFLQQLLRSPAYVEYLKSRGRICIQIGFSDSGRYMGQIGANLAIERLQSQFADALTEAGLRNLDVVIFNTHGESMGRGGYPGAIKHRYDHLLTPWVRTRYEDNGLRLIAESSFQGGDGFLLFSTPQITQRTVDGIFDWTTSPPNSGRATSEDKFYTEANYTWDIYQRILSWQKNLFERDDYQISLGSFAFNFLPVTGSRKARRQSGSALMGPKSLRAIPHNAILHQLAIPANVFGGIGSAVENDLDEFLDHVKTSDRWHQMLKLAREARRLTSLPVLRAYAILYDPTFWSSKASSSHDRVLSDSCSEIAERLGQNSVARSMRALSTHLSSDLCKLDRVLQEVFGDDEDQDRYAYRRPLHALHAVRQAHIMRGFLLVATLPSISHKFDLDRNALFELTFSLRFNTLADRLCEFFPISVDEETLGQLLTEPADPLASIRRGYPEIHHGIIDPLRQIHLSMQEASVGISNFYGAFG